MVVRGSGSGQLAAAASEGVGGRVEAPGDDPPPQVPPLEGDVAKEGIERARQPRVVEAAGASAVPADRKGVPANLGGALQGVALREQGEAETETPRLGVMGGAFPGEASLGGAQNRPHAQVVGRTPKDGASAGSRGAPKECSVLPPVNAAMVF